MRKMVLVLTAILSVSAISIWYFMFYMQIYYAQHNGTVIFNGFAEKCGNTLVVLNGYKNYCNLCKTKQCLNNCTKNYDYEIEYYYDLKKKTKFKVGQTINMGQFIAYQKRNTAAENSALIYAPVFKKAMEDPESRFGDMLDCNACLYRDCD